MEEYIDYVNGFVPGFVLITGRNEITISNSQAESYYHNNMANFSKAAKNAIEEQIEQERKHFQRLIRVNKKTGSQTEFCFQG